MNESILLRFSSQGNPLNVVDFNRDQGVTFDRHPDASPLNFAIGVQPLLPGQIKLVQQRHDWRDQQFLLKVVADSGGLRISGFANDPEGLPPGPYDFTFELESYTFRNDQPRVVIHKDQAVNFVLEEEPDLRRVQLRGNMDAMTARVVNDVQSFVDGVALATWLTSPDPRAARKACLLNLLCKLRVPPKPALGLPLTSRMKFIFFADVDRAYAAFDGGLRRQLDSYVDADTWIRDNLPLDAIHQRLRAGMQRIGVANADAYELASYRQGGRNCLQLVVATPPPGSGEEVLSYADVDIDLGNPLWDLDGLLVHIGELLDSGKTDHFALRKKLDQGDTKDFLFYDIALAQTA